CTRQVTGEDETTGALCRGKNGGGDLRAHGHVVDRVADVRERAGCGYTDLLAVHREIAGKAQGRGAARDGIAADLLGLCQGKDFNLVLTGLCAGGCGSRDE